jgi:hypothetical protein
MLFSIIDMMMKLKEGMMVMFRMLGELTRGTIIKERADGNYDVLSKTGTNIPNINWYDPQQKRKPWYIVQAGKKNVDPKILTTDEQEIRAAFETQKEFTRGNVKK